MSDKDFVKVFSLRTVGCFLIIALLFFGSILRLTGLSLGENNAVGQMQSSLRLTVGRQRGTVYDRNMIPITNREKKIIAAVSPTPRAITAISDLLDENERQSLLERLKSGKPVLCELEKEIDCDGIACTEVYTNGEENSATHMIGYVGNDGHGAAGIQKAYDEILYSDKSVSFSYAVSGVGDILGGIEPIVENDSSVAANGVVTTLDINIQKIAEEEAEKIECGAVIVASSDSNEILASVSRPDFDPRQIGEYLEKPDSPLLNRAISLFNVGSVFKPCVAAAAIENGKSAFMYNCVGKTEIIDRFFKCHNSSGHGLIGLKGGLSNSCNTYFYNLAFSIGGREIYNYASNFNFGKSFNICEGISSPRGSMPTLESLKNPAYLANFSIGQGELLLSPISLLTLYSAIATDGSYVFPSVVNGKFSDGSFEAYNSGGRTRVIKKETAARLREYLTAVVEEGTGTAAMPEKTSAAGKTATAQTGRYQNGAEICESWFCGFFPADKPRYTVIVFSENSKRQTASCAEIFSHIADRITELKQ